MPAHVPRVLRVCIENPVVRGVRHTPPPPNTFPLPSLFSPTHSLSRTQVDLTKDKIGKDVKGDEGQTGGNERG